MVPWVIEVGWMFGRPGFLLPLGRNQLCLPENVAVGIESSIRPSELADYSCVWERLTNCIGV